MYSNGGNESSRIKVGPLSQTPVLTLSFGWPGVAPSRCVTKFCASPNHVLRVLTPWTNLNPPAESPDIIVQKPREST